MTKSKLHQFKFNRAYNLIFVFLLSFNYSNISNYEILNKESFSSKVSAKLKYWNLGNNTNVTVRDSILFIDIYFKKNKADTINSFFKDRESNNMVITMLSHAFFNEVDKFNRIYYQLTFEGYPDTILVHFDNFDLNLRHQEFEKYPVFYEFVEYSLKNMQYMGVLGATQFMKYLDDIIDLRALKGSFWYLLYDYSKACHYPDEYIFNASLFIWITKLANDPEMERHSESYLHSLNYFVDYCDFEELSSMSSVEFYEFIQQKISE